MNIFIPNKESKYISQNIDNSIVKMLCIKLTSVSLIISPVAGSIISPNARPLMLHLLNVIMFWVRVPVLSENMYCIWPSSSFNVVVRALAGVFVFSWNIFSSQLTKNDWAKRITCVCGETKRFGSVNVNTLQIRLCLMLGLTSTET